MPAGGTESRRIRLPSTSRLPAVDSSPISPPPAFLGAAVRALVSRPRERASPRRRVRLDLPACKVTRRQRRFARAFRTSRRPHPGCRRIRPPQIRQSWRPREQVRQAYESPPVRLQARTVAGLPFLPPFPPASTFPPPDQAAPCLPSRLSLLDSDRPALVRARDSVRR